MATGSDTCGDVVITESDVEVAGCGNTKVITRTWVATDDCGNTTSGDQVITVEDTTPPSLTVPADVTIECTEDESSAGNGVATGSDTCGDVVITESDVEVAGCGNTKVITRTWVATDDCGNTTSGDQVITVVDTTAPTLDVPADVTIECTADESSAGNGVATGSDTCGSVVITESDVEVAGCGNTKVITRTWVATDDCGNTTSGDQVITVEDTTPPSLTVPADVTIECTEDESSAGNGVATGSDTCGDVVITESDVEVAGCGNTKVITRTWVATDDCGNTTSGDQIITVEDTTPPSLTVPADVTIECTADESSVGNGVATGSDTCGSVTITESDVEVAGCGNTKVITRTWVATDDCGNTTSGDQIITVVDTTAPSIVMPADVTVECTDSTAPAATGAATGSDTCGSVTIASSDVSVAGCGNTEVITRTWTVTDDCGNSTSADQVITVVDTTAPSLSVPADVTIECTADESSAGNGVATGSDTCGSVVITESDVSVAGCGNTKVITRTWVATDDCGNTTSGDQVITVVDTTAPSIVVPADVTIECPDDTSPAATGSATGSDTCGTVTIASSDVSVAGCGNTETITRTWTATDECGNSTSADQVITVIDTTAPVLTVPTETILLSCGAVFDPMAGVDAADACEGDVTVNVTIIGAVDTGAPGTYVLTYDVSDACGNAAASQSRTVLVAYGIDGLLPPLDDQDLAILVSAAAAGNTLDLDCSDLKNIKAKRGGLPLKIRLTDCSGVAQTGALLSGLEPKVTRILSLTPGAENPEIVDVVDPEDTGNSSPDGVMRISDDKWIYTLDVDDTGSNGLSAGCYAAEFEISLPGGGTVYAYGAFKLK